MSSSCLMVAYVGSTNHLFGHFLHRYEAVQAFDKGKEVHEEIIDKGLLEKCDLAMLW